MKTTLSSICSSAQLAISRRGRSLASVVMLVCAGIAGCASDGSFQWASYGPGPLKPGDPESAVLARMGAPTERVPLTNGTRSVYARGPFGKHTWFVDFGSDQRVQSVMQVLNEQRFAGVVPGMPKDELRAWLGPSSQSWGLAIEQRSVWAWRFESFDCIWFVTTLDRQGRVLDAGYGPDPICEVSGDDRM